MFGLFGLESAARLHFRRDVVEFKVGNCAPTSGFGQVVGYNGLFVSIAVLFNFLAFGVDQGDIEAMGCPHFFDCLARWIRDEGDCEFYCFGIGFGFGRGGIDKSNDRDFARMIFLESVKDGC